MPDATRTAISQPCVLAAFIEGSPFEVRFDAEA